jgi:hypothetical protein
LGGFQGPEINQGNGSGNAFGERTRTLGKGLRATCATSAHALVSASTPRRADVANEMDTEDGLIWVYCG